MSRYRSEDVWKETDKETDIQTKTPAPSSQTQTEKQQKPITDVFGMMPKVTFAGLYHKKLMR
eukprot:186605-Hanusia_phi.AAC.2